MGWLPHNSNSTNRKYHFQLLLSLFPCFPKEHPCTLLLIIFTSCHITHVLFFLRDRGSQLSAPGLLEPWMRIQLYNLGSLCHHHKTGRFPIFLQYTLMAQWFGGKYHRNNKSNCFFLTYSVIKHGCQILDKQKSSLDKEKWRPTQVGWITDVVNGASKKFICRYVQKSLHFTVTERPLASPKRSRSDRQINAIPANECIYFFPMWFFKCWI